MNSAIIKNISVNISVQVLTAIAGFILPPLIIATYGSTQNGMVASIAQFIAYLAIVEAGISSVSIAALAKPIYDGDKEKINSILSATQNFYSKAGGIFASMVLVLALLYPFIIAGEGVDKLTAGLMVLVISLGGILDFFVIGKYRALLIADRKNYIMGITRIISVIFNTIVSVILIKTNNSLLFVKFVSALIYIFSSYSILLVYIRKHYNFINLKEKFDKKTLEQKWDVVYHKFASMVIYNSPIVILTIFCPLYQVSIYSIYAMIFIAVELLVDTLSDGMMGFFGRFLAENNPEKLKKKFSEYETVYFMLIGIGYTCAMLLTIPFMQIYTKNMADANYIQPTLVLFFVIAGIMNKLRIPASIMLLAAGHFKQTKWRAVAEAVINVSASIFFVIKFGFIGVLLGTVCAFSYRTIDIIVYSSKRIVYNNLFASFFKILFLGIWYLIGYYILSGFVISDINNYFDFAKNAVISIGFLAIPAGIYLLNNFRTNNRVFLK